MIKNNRYCVRHFDKNLERGDKVRHLEFGSQYTD